MNRNRIKFARGNIASLLALTGDNAKVPYGQPIFVNDRRYLVIGKKEDGNGEFEFKKHKPITVRDLIGYFDDNGDLTGNVTQLYQIVPTSDELLIESSKDVKIKVSNSVYAKFNTSQNVITGDTLIDVLKTSNINSNKDISIKHRNEMLADNNRKACYIIIIKIICDI